MDQTTTENAMAKRNDESTKIGADVLADARIVASFRGDKLAVYLTEALRPVVAKDLAHEMAKRAKADRRHKEKGGKEG